MLALVWLWRRNVPSVQIFVHQTGLQSTHFPRQKKQPRRPADGGQGQRSTTELNTLGGFGLDGSIGDSCDAVTIPRKKRGDL